MTRWSRISTRLRCFWAFGARFWRAATASHYYRRDDGPPRAARHACIQKRPQFHFSEFRVVESIGRCMLELFLMGLLDVVACRFQKLWANLGEQLNNTFLFLGAC